MQSTNDIDKILAEFKAEFYSLYDLILARKAGDSRSEGKRAEQFLKDKLTTLSKTIREEERETWQTTHDVKIKWVFKDDLREKIKLSIAKKGNK